MAELAKEIGVVKVERQCLERGSGATGGKELEREREYSCRDLLAGELHYT